MIHTNLNGAFFTVNSAAPLLNETAASYLVVVHNYLGQPGVAAYAVTKGGPSRWRVPLRRPCTAQHSRERRRTGRDQDSHLEARAASRYFCRRVRQVREVLLVCQSDGAAGASRKTLLTPCSSLRRTIPHTSMQLS